MKPYSWFRFLVFACICINYAFSKSETDVSYTKHCQSVIPLYNVTARGSDNALPSLSTPYFTGGESFLRTEPGRTYYYVQKNLRLRFRSDHYETTAAGVSKVEGFLYIRFPYSSDDASANYSYGGYNRRRNRRKASIRFPVNGYWSEKSRKLCMVGSALWRGIDRDAVLKLKFDDENPTIYTGVVSGSLESAAPANSPAYFDPILIFSFPEASNYKYSLVPKEVEEAFPSRKDESLSIDAAEFCSEMVHGLRSLELEYATECTGRRPHRCSPVGVGDDFSPRFLSLSSIQCSQGPKKARFVAIFLNYSSYSYDYNSFALGTTMIGEASWDDKNNRMIGVACEILNPSHQLGKVVGDCRMRLSLRHPSVLTIRNDAKIVGQIWSSKAADEFRQIYLTTTYENRVVGLPEQRYKYTELDRARKSCPTKKVAKKGNVYPDGQSYYMRFDMNIKNSKGQEMAWASGTPSWVENELYQGDGGMMIMASASVATLPDADAQSAAAILEPQKRNGTRPTKMMYKIRIYPYYHVNSSSNISSPSLDWAGSPYVSEVVITAEGEYDDNNGHLCMVGCRNLVLNSTSTSKDCEVVVELELSPLNGERGGFTNGTIRSTRPKKDALHFDDLILQSTAYYRGEAERSIWRMDLEIAMVLISNTLICIFVALQIFHVKRNPEVPSFISFVMVVILSVGHMIPLVLNFEAVFLGSRDKQTLELSSGGRLEANEVAVRVITMVALLLLLRLLQLVWTAKQSDSNGKSSWSGEKKSGFVSLSLYILGGLLTLLLNWMRKLYVGPYEIGRRFSVWGDLRSSAGVILDGFLVPQILLNILRGSSEKALAHTFYIGTSAIRLVPHAYNQYRAHNYPKYDLNATYYYANPAADLYSTAWDIIIPCGIVALAVIVFVQQCHGGRCILPQRFRSLEMYEKVPSADNHQ